MFRTIRDWSERSEGALNNLLSPVGVSEQDVQRMVQSGYIHWHMAAMGSQPTPVVYDTFYGNKSSSSMFTAERFSQAISDKSASDPVRGYPRTRTIASLNDAKDALLDVHPRFSGRLSFRGQTVRHFVKRAFPNPIAAREDNSEELIIPSFYRTFGPTFLDRPLGKAGNIFATYVADDLIYDGIDRSKLSPHYSLDDLKDSANPVDREYHRRWVRHKVEAPFKGDLGVLEQHYGIPTTGLDLTFNIATALFFATHRFTCQDEHATFIPVEQGKHEGVVYCFVFHDPSCRASSDIISELQVFDHMPPRRPIAQECCLRNFTGNQMNQAHRDLEIVLEINENFNFDGLPLGKALFPSPDDDPFYRGLLNLKAKWPEDFADIPSYRF